MQKFIKLIPSFFLFSTILCFAASDFNQDDLVPRKTLDSVINGTGTVTDYLNKGKLFTTGFNIPGIVSGNIVCEFDKFNLPSLEDLCDATYGAIVEKAIGKIDKFLKKMQSISLGPCKISSDKTKQCRNDKIQKLCQKLRNKDVTKKPTFSAEGIGDVAIEKLVYTGGEVFFKNGNMDSNACTNENGEEVWDKVKYGYVTAKDMYDNKLSVSSSKQAMNGISIVDNMSFAVYEACVKQMSNAGHEDAIQRCSAQSGNYGLAENESEVQKSKAREVETHFTDPTSDLSQKNLQIETYLASEYLKHCDSPDPSFNSAECENGVYENAEVDTTVNGSAAKVSLARENLNVKKAIETNQGVFAEFVDVATEPKYKINHHTNDALKRIKPEYRVKYISLSRKQVAFETLKDGIVAKMSKLKKELVDINYQKNKIAAKPFYQQQAIAKAKMIMEVGLE